MVTKITTHCDRCGGECEYGATRFSATTEHWTSQRETVGEDYYKPAELCITCGEIVAQMIGMVIRNSEKYERDGEQVAPHVEIRPLPALAVCEEHRPGVLARSHP